MDIPGRLEEPFACYSIGDIGLEEPFACYSIGDIE